MALIIAWVAISIILAWVVIGWIAWHYISKYLDTHVRMGIFADIPTSLKNSAIYLNFVNAKRYKEFWDVHEDQLKLFAMGAPINAVFYKTKDVPNGYKIAYSSTLSNVEILSMISAMKYNTLEVSFDGGITRRHINSLHDKTAERISKKLEEHQVVSHDRHKEDILKKIIKSGKTKDIKELNDTDRVIAHINEGRTTGTTMRFQVIIPPSHKLIKSKMFDPENPVSNLFYIYEGHCYKLETKFVGRIDNLYEWDIVNLKPGTIYPGISFSVDGGKTTLPSSAMYGITKDKHGELPTIDDSILAKPTPDEEQFPMWHNEEGVEYVGESIVHKIYAILIKKHFEDEYSEEYLALNRTHEYYDDYEWLKLGEHKHRKHLFHRN